MCKKIKSVKIAPGCISCGTCEAVCPAVFKVTGVAHVKEDAPIQEHVDLIKEAEYMCPVNVIQVEEE